MMPKSKIVLSAAIMLFTTVAAASKDDRLPNIDIKKWCDHRAKSSADMLGDKSATAKIFDSCMKSEQEARAALVAAWKDIPPYYRTTCIKPNDYSPSHIEWIACLELNMEVKRLRSKN